MATTETPRRGYAVGVQLFDWIRERGSMYVDKTGYIYKMVSTDAQYFFLSRPRRFGKSLLVDTLRCYFEGRKVTDYVALSDFMLRGAGFYSPPRRSR